MPEIARVTTVWNGFPGAPGYTKFSFFGVVSDADRTAIGAAARTFFSSLATVLVPASTYTVSPIVQVFDMVTGTLLREDSMLTPPAVVTGSGAAVPYSGGVGAVITWKTNLIARNRHVRGRTFLVPLIAPGQADGTLSSAMISLVQGAADALIANGSTTFGVWHRHFTAPPHPVQDEGGFGEATVASVPDRTGILRSRRD